MHIDAKGNKTATVRLDKWHIGLFIDDDGHLGVYLSHEDGSPVKATDADIGTENEWGDRFTTEAIEKAYSEIQRKNLEDFKKTFG